VHECLSLLLGADITVLLCQVDTVRGAIVLDDLRVVYRDVSCPLIEIVDGIAPFAHHLGHQTIGDANGGCRIIDEPGLHLVPAGREIRQGRRRQRNDVEFVSLPFPGGEFFLSRLFVSGLGYQTLILAAIVLLQSLCFLATAHEACGDEHCGDRDRDAGRDQNPFPNGHFALLSYSCRITPAAPTQTLRCDVQQGRYASACGRRVLSEVVPAAADGATGGTQDCQDCADDDEDDPEGPQDRDLEQKSRDQQDDAENDHGEPSPLSDDWRSGRVGCPDADLSRSPLRGVSIHP
jgi:hypothetical protein